MTSKLVFDSQFQISAKVDVSLPHLIMFPTPAFLFDIHYIHVHVRIAAIFHDLA